MIPTLLGALVAALVRSLAAVRLDRWNIGAPLVMVVAGAVVGLTVESSIAAVLNTGVAEKIAEIILAILLFVDATEIRGGRLLGSAPRVVARVLFVALPLALLAAVLLGRLFFSELPWAMLLVLACVVVPIDFAPLERVLRDPRVPGRVRSVLNVEGGYNDGILSPIFVFGLILAGSQAQSHGPLQALTAALPQALKAVAVGLVLGAVLAWLSQWALRAGWTTDQSRRIVVVLIPVLTWAVAVGIGGNGFVAAFVCGITLRQVQHFLVARRPGTGTEPAERTSARALTDDLRLIEEVTSLLTMAMWFVVGIAGVVLVSVADVGVVLFCVLALTLVRLVPVGISLLGSSLDQRERLLVGLLGPRGTTTIVFGLLAFNQLPEGPAADTVLITTVVCVVGSVLLHGLGASAIIDRLTRERTPASSGRPS